MSDYGPWSRTDNVSEKGMILVTGGAGYIGSHACVALLEAGYQIVVIDNLANGSSIALARVKTITKKNFDFIEADIRDATTLDKLFKRYPINGVMHFAGLKAVGESCANPLLYYENNVGGTLSLCRVMKNHGIGLIIFSSSATVYGEPELMPVRESCPLRPTNPYGHSKKIIEDIFRDLAACDRLSNERFWRVGLLRYFNPIGAHPSGVIGEAPHGAPNNLVPFMLQVATGERKELLVYGDDYPTPDGTGIRDYIHVMDLVAGHIKALEFLFVDHAVAGVQEGTESMSAGNSTSCRAWNLGTGRGYSVFEIIKAFERATGMQVPYKVVDRRAGDIAKCWADPASAKLEINWQAERNLKLMLEDSWRWQMKNPTGYSE
jgi:UDP-glucose 4-epimerase